MERVSKFNFLSTAVLVMFMLNSATSAAAAVHGGMATISDEETEMKYKMIAENENQETKMSAMKPIYSRLDAIREAQNKLRMAMSTEEVLKCAGAGGYCNNLFGPSCCSGFIACLPPTSLVGGVCVS